jgi:hypothetical protein
VNRATNTVQDAWSRYYEAEALAELFDYPNALVSYREGVRRATDIGQHAETFFSALHMEQVRVNCSAP